MKQRTTQTPILDFHGALTDPGAFTRALGELVEAAARSSGPALLVREGVVVAVADRGGRVSCLFGVQVEGEPLAIEVEGDGWYQSATATYYVHRGRPFALLRQGRLHIHEVESLPSEAQPMTDDAVSELLHVAADAVEIYAETHG